MLLSQQFCVLLFDLRTASSLFSSTGLPELGRQPVPLDFMGKWTPKSESRAASWRRYQGRQIRSLQGDRRKKNLPQKRRGLGDREPAKERAPECTTQNHPDSLLTLHGMWHQSGASTPAQHGKKGPTTLQLQTLGEGLVIQSVQVLTDWILSDRKISSICGNF